MKDLNRVQLIGHLGQDSGVTYTATGTARTTFSVAARARWKDADGQVQEATEWTRCSAWGALAEVCAQYVAKGSRVYVAGRLHSLRWQDAETGERQARVEIVLDDLICSTVGVEEAWQRPTVTRRCPAKRAGTPGAVDLSNRPLHQGPRLNTGGTVAGGFKPPHVAYCRDLTSHITMST